jgi:DNA-binding GntR family transcriptional regulator
MVGRIISKDAAIANDKRFTYNRSAMPSLAELFDPGVDTSIRKGDQLWSRVANHLRHEIFTGHKVPGERLVETRIAAQLGIAQSSVREALHELEREGLVVRIPGAGARVTNLTPVQIEQIYALRAELEGFAVELVGRKKSAADLDALEACLVRCREAGSNDVAYMSADLEFHLALWKSAGNEFLLEAVSRIVIPLFAFETRAVVPRLSLEERLESLAQHYRVIELLRADDVPGARQAIVAMMAAFQQQTRGLAPGRP